jgi:hypothetical protein
VPASGRDRWPFLRELQHTSLHGRQFPSEVHGKQILVRRSWLRLKQSIWFRRSAAGRGGIDLRGYLFQKPVEAVTIRIALELLCRSGLYKQKRAWHRGDLCEHIGDTISIAFKDGFLRLLGDGGTPSRPTILIEIIT